PPPDGAPGGAGGGPSDRGRPGGPDAAPATGAAQAADNADSATAVPARTPPDFPAPGPEPAAAAPSARANSGGPAPQPARESAPAASPADGRTRRPPGALERTALRIMQANPDTPYKVTALGRLIDLADAADGHSYPKASPGAVVLVCDRLVDKGTAIKIIERPATYQFAAAQPAKP
ncbi:hypothetical protein K1W54_06965, partial [Micromonospora sp. CPCC 205371]|nr:hypothetical protein [Micromonospora sp. CPCC 205371]